MRRIVMFNRVTLEGYFAAADGSLDWVVQDEEIDKSGAGAVSQFDTVLFGRRTYELFEKFWPHALDDSMTAQDPHRPARRSAEMRAMAVMLNDAQKLVFSRTLREATWKNSRLIREFDAREIESLKGQAGKDMIIFGSGAIVSQLTAHRLIDEYQFVVSPMLLGGGRPLLTGISNQMRLNLQESKAYKSGNVMIRYARQ